jgi:cell division protein FtsA
MESVALTQIGRTEPRPLRRRALCEIVEARMQELFHLVKKELLRADCMEKMTAGVVLTGGGARLHGSIECAAEVLKAPVRLGLPSGVGGLADAAGGPEFATAVGLVRWAIRAEDAGRPSQQAGALQQLSRFLSRLRPR